MNPNVRRGQFAAERLAVHCHLDFLRAHIRMFVIHEAVHAEFVGRINSNAAVTIGKFQRLDHANVTSLPPQFANPGLRQQFDERFRGTIQDREFQRVQLDVHIVDTAGVQRCEQVLHGREQHALFHQAGGVTHPRDVANVRFDLEVVQVHPPENDAGICRSWNQPQVAAHGGVKSDAASFDWSLYRELVRHQLDRIILCTSVAPHLQL